MPITVLGDEVNYFGYFGGPRITSASRPPNRPESGAAGRRRSKRRSGSSTEVRRAEGSCTLSAKAVTIDSKKLEHGFKVVYTGLPSLFCFGTADSHLPSFWLLRSRGRPYCVDQKLDGSNVRMARFLCSEGKVILVDIWVS